MQRKHITPVLTAVLGFSLAWMLKPTPELVASNGAPEDPEIKARASTGARSPSMPKKQTFDPLTHTSSGKELPPELVLGRTKLANQLSDSMEKRDQAAVQRLTELLQLSPEQQQQLQMIYETKRSTLNFYRPGDGVTHANMLEKAESAESKFKQALSAILEPSQIEKYNAYRKQQSENQRLAAAQKDYADVLEKIDLSPDQQRALQSALQQEALTREDGNADQARFFEETFDAMGFGSAGVAMSRTQTANAAILQSSDREEMAKTLVEERKKATAERIAMLRNVLSPAQLSQYTAVLESRDQSFFSSITPHIPTPTPSLVPEEK